MAAPALNTDNVTFMGYSWSTNFVELVYNVSNIESILNKPNVEIYLGISL